MEDGVLNLTFYFSTGQLSGHPSYTSGTSYTLTYVSVREVIEVSCAEEAVDDLRSAFGEGPPT